MSSGRWNDLARPALDQLARRESLAFICGSRPDSVELITDLATATLQSAASISEVGLVPNPAESAEDLSGRLAGSWLLFDLESLCWSPWLRVDPIRFLRLHARNHGVICVWPGHRVGRAMTFSQPGRPDYVNFDARGLAVLHPTKTQFPDELPFTLERITT